MSRIWDQPDAVTYVDDDGKIRRHTFDFMVILNCGRRIAYAVKPRAKVERSGILRIIELIRQQVGDRFADAYVLRTDEDITPTRVSNAHLIVMSQAERNDDHVSRVRLITASMVGAARIADVAARSGLHGHALRAIACLIGDGVIRLAHPGLINHSASIAPASPAAR